MRVNEEAAADFLARRANWTADDAEAILRSHHCRATGPRLAVLRALLRHGGPIDAAALTSLAQREESGIHEATVYRTINVLSEQGIVTHVHAGHGPSLVRLGAERELLAVCRECGAIVELPTSVVRRLATATQSATGFVLDPGHFALEGVCRDCP